MRSPRILISAEASECSSSLGRPSSKPAPRCLNRTSRTFPSHSPECPDKHRLARFHNSIARCSNLKQRAVCAIPCARSLRLSEYSFARRELISDLHLHTNGRRVLDLIPLCAMHEPSMRLVIWTITVFPSPRMELSLFWLLLMSEVI